MTGTTESVSVTVDSVSVDKSVRAGTDDTQIVTLQFRSERDEPLLARFEEEVPGKGSTTVSVGGDADGHVVFDGGTLSGTVSIPPDGAETFTYARRAETTDNGSSPPHLLDIVTTPTNESLGPHVLRWRSPAGERVTLTTETGDTGIGADRLVVDGGWDPDRASSTVERTESEPKPEGEAGPQSTGAERPAIGIIARAQDADAVYRTVLEAQRREFDVFVTSKGKGTVEILDIIGQIGAHIVPPPNPDTDWLTLEATLAAAARSAGHVGIVFQPEGCPRIDYERTLEAFEASGFEIHAISEPSDRRLGRPHVLVGIPAYNAAGSIAEVVTEAKRFADEVLVVDDGSDDDTAQRARDAGATVVIHPRNRGYGGALKTLFREADRMEAVHLVTIDADGQHDPDDIPRLVAVQDDSEAGVVIASRYVGDSETDIPFVRSVGLLVVNILTNVSMGRFRPSRWIRDTQSGFRAYTADAVDALVTAGDIGDGMWASTDILYETSRAGFDFREVGTSIRYDVEYGSTEGAATHGFGLVHNIIGFFQRSHPLLLVGMPGLVLFLIGITLGVWSIQLLLAGRFLLPLAITTGFAIGIGGVMMLLSALLHVMNTHPFFNPDK